MSQEYLAHFRNVKSLKLYITLATYTGCFIIFSVITNIYKNKTKGLTLLELLTVTEKLKVFFDK
jgi:hypothetical protein